MGMPVLTVDEAAQALGLSREAVAAAADLPPDEAARYLGIAVSEAESVEAPAPAPKKGSKQAPAPEAGPVKKSKR